jgi:mannose/fructose-specific phosphotransferase system component IIA
MSLLTGVVVGHGDVAAAMIDAVQRIAGQADALVAISNTDCDRGTLEQRITDAVGTQPAIVFIDMPSGSCLFAAMRRLQEMPDVRLVTGVNLAMLLEFVFHRDGSVDQVAAHVAEAGARAVGTR